MIFLVLLGKMIFLFLENMILHLENERWSFSKKYTEILYFLQTFWKDGLFKKDHAGIWSLLYYLKRWYFFPKTWYFFLGQGAGGDFSQEIQGDMIFSVYTYMCYKRGATALCQKTSEMVLSSKNTPNRDWCSRLASYKKLQQFSVLSWRPLQACSCIALQSSETKQET